jgi:hypothetical protein
MSKWKTFRQCSVDDDGKEYNCETKRCKVDEGGRIERCDEYKDEPEDWMFWDDYEDEDDD